MTQNDPRKPIIISLIVLGVLMLAGIIFAALTAGPAQRQGAGAYDANVSFIDDNDPRFGNESAKVVVRAFEDFECSACRAGSAGLSYAMEKYADRVLFIWNDFPLVSSHPKANAAANVARCAEEQGMFWEYEKKLFAEQPYWISAQNEEELFADYAASLNMRRGAFESCLANRTFQNKINNDQKEGLANRVNATPTFFVNQTKYVGVLSNAEWDAAIQAALGE